LECYDISRISETITAKRMKIDPFCQRRNCSPLNALFSDVYCIVGVDIAGRSPAMGRQTSAGWGKHAISSKMRQYHSPDGADGCCIASDKLLTCLQLVFHVELEQFSACFRVARVCQRQLGFLVRATVAAKLVYCSPLTSVVRILFCCRHEPTQCVP